MVHLHIWSQEGFKPWRVVCQGNGLQRSWDIESLDQAFEVARYAMNGESLPDDVKAPVDRFANLAAAIDATNKAVDALRVGMETLEKRDHHLRNWLVKLEDKMMANPSQKTTPKKRMKPLAKVARKTKAKARVKAKQKA